jgi:NADH dehydrogenase (ubiquinone) Fe-S protein 4
MSLLRSCTQSASILRRSGISGVPQLARYVSTEPAQAVEKKGEEKSGDIAIPPTRDVLVADVISGAPRAFAGIVN